MQIRLSDHFTLGRLLRFTLPSVIMMVVASLYSVVDGLFVSNLVGDLALSAVNIVMPIAMIVGAFGFMLGTGGSAIVARTMGEGDRDLANRYFSLFVWCVVGLGAALSLVCVIFMEPIVRLAGASDLLVDDCVIYGRILLAGSVPFMLQTSFQSFFVVAERPHAGLVFSLAAGGTNMVLDYVFIALLDMGIAGAALATVAAPSLAVLSDPAGLAGKWGTRDDFLIASSCLNSTVSGLLSRTFYRRDLIGEKGVAAYSVMMYVDFVFVAAFLGFSVGSAPVVSFHYGAANHKELQNVFRKSMAVITVTSLAMVLLSEVLCRPLSAAFVGYDPALMEMTVSGFRLFALCYFFCGVSIFASSFFTALCNGLISALISFLRSFLLRGGLVFLMPLLLGETGIWISVVAADAIGAAISLTLLALLRPKYQY